MPGNTPKTKILIADDEKIIADTLAMILNQSGFEARAVYAAEKAIELSGEFQPDVLIFDVIMSGLNGVDAAVKLRGSMPRIRVFLLSGQTATDEILANAHASDYGFEVLVKPVHPQELLARLRAHSLVS